ncbi:MULTISPECIES: malate dehydrogenase [Pseudanabaena]|uniref:Malate dehydrogenase n=2 Tax=Pseudanabaena TaxID=1152 RepID=L8N2V8_9CYAN|nr:MULTISPECIES: malate dehydrogenase [Pseudanabaena]ELS34031.1 Malate dehydrogenase [Pseudanabaena biceps PCC 7429]MDG3493759.1 malate dehydrogenase [Pseudanabaena catenata USMAC16]
MPTQVEDYRSPKVTVVGAGNVGGMLAQRIAKQNLADVVLYDIVQGKPQGIALDLLQAHTISDLDRQIIGTNDYSDTKDSDIIVVTAGLPRKDGMSRNDLLRINASIVKDVVQSTISLSPNAILLIVTNPLDVMTYLAWQVSGLPPQRVIGMAGVLDAARFQTFIAMELKISSADIYTTVLGGHGDLMLPLPRLSTVNGVPITELLSQEAITRLVERTRNGGAEIVQLLQNGSAYFAPSAAVNVMVESIISDRHRVLPAAAYLTGEYGLRDIFMGVPVQLGRQGAEKIVELKLLDEELAALHASAASIQANINLL